MKNTSYFYHRTSHYNVTVAYRRNNDGTVSYGASFCRPTDSFSKSLGREIATGRLDIAFPTIANPPSERWALHEIILRRLENQEFGYVPDCFRR